MAVVETRFRVMASEAQVIVVDGPSHTGELARQGLADLERAWSRFRTNSDIERINNSPGIPVLVNDVTITLLETMLEAWKISSGVVDPTVLPALMEAGYRASIEDPRIVTRLPDDFQVGAGDLSDITVDPDRRMVTMPAGLAIDPGGIGKGLAADLIVAELLAAGAAGVLVSVGGDLAAAGRPGRPEGWTVDVEDPFSPGVALVRLAISGGGVATSSTLSRRWNDGRSTSHHLIDPATREPSRSDLAAASVIAPCGWLAEAHATAIVIGGARQFVDYTRRHGIDAIATTSTGETIATEQLMHLLPSVVRT